MPCFVICVVCVRMCCDTLLSGGIKESIYNFLASGLSFFTAWSMMIELSVWVLLVKTINHIPKVGQCRLHFDLALIYIKRKVPSANIQYCLAKAYQVCVWVRTFSEAVVLNTTYRSL